MWSHRNDMRAGAGVLCVVAVKRGPAPQRHGEGSPNSDIACKVLRCFLVSAGTTATHRGRMSQCNARVG